MLKNTLITLFTISILLLASHLAISLLHPKANGQGLASLSNQEIETSHQKNHH